jgi:hypothetical protein
MTGPSTFYANIVNLKATLNELVFEFGAIFPEAPPSQQQQKAVQFDPEVRVVMSLQALRMLSQALQQAIAQMEQTQAQKKDDLPPQSEPLGTASKQ